ncbi:MAG: ATP-binding protein [Lacrimispora sp.]|nr:ATP-binding protein [Lacrimispora sp.]
MDNYINSVTWKKTLGLNNEDTSMQEYISHLKNSYMSIRKKSIYLASEIARFLPNYTVHDITHIDALWEATDIILPEAYELNPVEGYVLGVAFLIHDLGMGLVAYTNGEEEIKQLSIWKDTVATEFNKRYGRKIEEKDWKCLEPEIKSLAQENTLRKLHAVQAVKLPTLEWEFEGKREWLIDNIILREAYGEIVGLIAYSHWWNIDKLKKEFQNKYLGAISIFPKEWTVDVIKLACILRIADATQIDDRRAPIFLLKLRKPKDVSKIHWIFQNKLYQPMVNNGRILYTSKSSFSIDEMEAWWTCYDTLKMINRELGAVDTLLIETDHKQFAVTGVGGISNAKELSNNVLVSEWVPLDTSIRVGNVGKLVSNLGGTQLYGNNFLVPMRELIQNGGDAIRARKILEDDEEYIGNITVSFYDEEDYKIIQIDDNGIGMSQKVLMGPFLDFGQSFWNTELMYDELPGLSSKGFSSTGQYGIGFYSVFIWSYDVTVISKRYDAAREDTLVLEFKKGTDSRPILRKAQKNEQIKDGGTIIKVRTQKNIFRKILQINRIEESIDNTIAKLCPCLD